MIGEQPLRGLRALIVEDEYLIADDLKRILKHKGAENVTLSGTIYDAFEQIRRKLFEFVIVDLNIQGEMAFSVCDELLRYRVPFAFVSGYDRSIIPPRFSGIQNWGKPYNDQKVVASIQTLWTRPINA